MMEDGHQLHIHTFVNANYFSTNFYQLSTKKKKKRKENALPTTSHPRLFDFALFNCYQFANFISIFIGISWAKLKQ